MQIILLSGGSGKRLWPLSNDARSKQFLRLLPTESGSQESMVQRITNQINKSSLKADITFATSITQRDSIINQLGSKISIVTEPERRDTFPAIALATSYLSKEKACNREEVIVVMPSDPFTEEAYFETITKMVDMIESNAVEMALMGIMPYEPSTKFGYIVPQKYDTSKVERFTEKPDVETAKLLLSNGALWNGGVFAFKLGYLLDIVEKYITADTFDEIHSRYAEFPKISFDYEVVEKASSVGVVPFSGMWNDLGTWDSLVSEIQKDSIGNVLLGKECKNSCIINELELPIIALGLEDIIVAASPDGILASKRESSVDLKSYADSLKARPMYEERRWGTYKVMGSEHFNDGYNALTKLLYLNAGCNISYQYHNKREEIWTFVDGDGLLVIDGETIKVSRGYVAHIKAGQKHAVKAITDLQIIEVQTGTDLVEEDIFRLDWEWKI